MVSSADLLRRIRLGEDSKWEFKRVMLSGSRVRAPARDDFADELAAFANGRGGSFLLGIEDETKEVLGIDINHLDAVEGWVQEVCNDVIKPPLTAGILKLELPNSTGDVLPIIRVDVPRSLFVHKSPGGYFHRIGSSKREMTPELLARLFQARTQTGVIRFDESTVPGTSLNDLDSELSQRFLRDNAERTETALRKLRILADDEDGNPCVTVTGILLCTQEPRQWMPHALIQAVSYRGERADVNYQDDARDLTGPLDEQVREALHFVRRNSRVGAHKPIARTEQPQFSERALFEALVNAVAHRDYSMAGARIRLHMFSDRIEFYVPGGLANTLTPDSMHLRQYNRNELIVSLLTRCPVSDEGSLGRTHLMDRRGDGVPIIFSESTRLAGRKPEYTVVDDSELQLVIWAA